MAGKKRIGWTRLASALLLVVSFVAISLLPGSPAVRRAIAAPNTSYAWADVNTIIGSGGGQDTRFGLNREKSDALRGQYDGITKYFEQYSPAPQIACQVAPGEGTNVPHIIMHSQDDYEIIWYTVPASPTNKNCEKQSERKLKVANNDDAMHTTFTWKDSATIIQIQENESQNPQGATGTFVSDVSSPNEYFLAGETDGCINSVVPNGDKKTGTYHLREPDNGGCSDETSTVSIAYPANASTAGTPSTGGPGSGSSTNSGGETDPYLACGDTVSLTWLLCPIIKLVNVTVSGLDNAINSLLTVDQEKIFDRSDPNGSGATYHKSWTVFRSFALAVLVIAGVLMVISQALGWSVFDAYTVKKVLPRLLIAIIAISLSWEIMKFLVVLTNDLGNGIRHIIYYPFQENKSFQHGVILQGGGSAILFLLGLGAFLGLQIAGLFSFVITAALAVGIAFLVLILRQMVIIMLVLFAPIAIACSVLPNTQGAYKLWYESFTKALMMFPIIAAFVALGRVFSVVTINSDSGVTGPITQIIALAAYILPYFLIPLTFKLAGGALRVLGGSINDRNRGAFDKLKKYRQGKIANNMEAMKAGNRFKSENWAARKFNTTTSNIAAIPQAGANPLKMRQRMKAFQSNEGLLAANEYAEKNQAFQAIKDNDAFLIAGMKGKGNDKKVRESLMDQGIKDEATLNQAVAAIRAARRDTSADVFDTAAALRLPGTGTAFKGGAGEMHDVINEVAGDDRVKAGRMLAAMRSGASQARRFDISGGGFGDELRTMEKQYANKKQIEANPLLSAAQKEAALKVNTAAGNDLTFKQALEGQGGSYIAGARPGAVKNLAPAIVDKLDFSIGTGDKTVIDRELAAIAGRYDAMASVSPENARVLADNVMAKERTINGKTQTVQKHIEDRRIADDNDAFVQMRREYGRAAQNGALQAELQQNQLGGPVPPVQGPPPGMGNPQSS